jgi:molybdopterin/thiamine biosynthesis adenylyltransferase
MEERRHVVIAGAGGNTGSHLLPHLGRMHGIARLTLVDPDVYTAGNLSAQDIETGQVGEVKVRAQAARLRAINPTLDVTTMAERIEDVPRGLLRGDLLVSCLDSRAARQHVNEIAYRLGVAWIDCGVLGSQNLARVTARLPAADAACLECPWDRDGYALVEQEYACGFENSTVQPTMASSALGGLAAALVAIEIAKLLGGEVETSAVGRQVTLDAQHLSLVVSLNSRNPNCLFDHRTWCIEPWRCRLQSQTVGDTLATLGSLRVEGHRFVYALMCPGCGRREESLRLNRPQAHCATCGRRMTAPGFEARDRLDINLPREYLNLTLAQIGLRAEDVVSAGDWHYQLKEAA